ncbi:MAG: hypothetical protein QM750_11835 [Rubrivivax sp.]
MAGPWERYAGEAEVAGPWQKYRAAPTATAPGASSPPPVDPTEGMSAFDRAAAGAGKAMSDAWLGIRGLTGNATAEEVEERRRLDAPLMNTAAGAVGNIAGQVGAALIPGGLIAGAGKLAGATGLARAGAALAQAGKSAMAPTTLRGAAALGAGTGALQPATDMGERLENAAWGAGGAAGGYAALKGLARIARPKTDSNALQLLAEGITPTPGQVLGGGFKRVEEALTSVPIVGDAIRAGQARAVADLNRAAINRALKPVGETLPAGMAGREAIEYAGDALGKRYEQLLPKVTLQADNQFMQELINLRNMVGTGSIDPNKARQFEALLQNQVLAKFMPGANGAPTLTGQTLKGIESDLGQLAKRFRASPDVDQQMVGDALRELQDMLRNNVARLNPQHAAELRKINEGYANFKRVQRAASSVAAEDGVFSPAQLHSSVKALDPRKDKAGFASGTAMLQDLAEPAKAVLGPKVPDSGTPLRLMTSLGAGGGLAALSPETLVGSLLASSAYSKPGQNALAALLARRPDAAKPVASALERLAQYAAPVGAGWAEP